MTPVLLAVNAGSATLKFRTYSRDGRHLRLHGVIDRFGSPQASLRVTEADGTLLAERGLSAGDRAAAVAAILEQLRAHGEEVTGVAHRVVHGGELFSEPVRITPAVREALEGFVPLAPLHQPVSLGVIDAFANLAPPLPQAACFDTAFHAHQPQVASRFAIARHWHDQGVRRYGFHGLSYGSIARQLPAVGLGDARVVVCHLGSGASACALRQGVSIASSMGFSALDGLMMGTRPGALDAEVVLYWMEHEGMSIDEVRRELYKHSGLLGVSGISADMRDLLGCDVPAALEAVDLFCYRAAKEIAALATAMEGLDAVVFTAGIGERSPEVRARILARLAWLGFTVEPSANLANAQCISAADSRRSAWVLQTDEEGEMARLAAPLLAL